jgi:hypothetical protein
LLLAGDDVVVDVPDVVAVALALLDAPVGGAEVLAGVDVSEATKVSPVVADVVMVVVVALAWYSSISKTYVPFPSPLSPSKTSWLAQLGRPPVWSDAHARK